MDNKSMKACFPSFPLLILVILLYPPGNVWSAFHFVKPDGTGSSCTRSAPCLFTEALTNADPGDTIVFKEGEYTRTLPLPPYPVIGLFEEIILMGGWDGSDSGTLVINPDRHPSILNGQDLRPVLKIVGPISATITGFTIQNGNANNSQSTCYGVISTGCGGGIYVYLAAAMIRTNKIQNNQANEGQGSGGGVHLESASGTILMNNLIQDNQAGIRGGGLSIFGPTAIPPKLLQKNRFIHNSALIGGVFFDIQTNPTIHDSIFENNIGTMAAGIFGFGPGDLARNLFQNHSGFAVVKLGEFSGNFQNNQLLNNSVSRGLSFSGSPVFISVISNNIIARSGLENGLFANELVNAVIEHNTLVGENIGTAIRVKSSTPLGLNNNIVAGYPVGIDATDSEGTVLARHTLFDNSVTTQGINITMVNPLVGDPAFKDPAANDFHIKRTSAARDAGTANFMTTNQDMDGEPRPMGSAPDIGADEFNPSLLNWLYLPLIHR